MEFIYMITLHFSFNDFLQLGLYTYNSCLYAVNVLKQEALLASMETTLAIEYKSVKHLITFLLVVLY